MKIQPVTSIHDIKGIHILYDKLKANLRALDTLGISSFTCRDLLIPILIKKIPEELSRAHTDLENLEIGLNVWKTWKTHGKFFFKETHGKVMEFFCHTSKKGVLIIIGSPWTLYG